MERTKEIDLQAVFQALLRKIWLIVLCAVLFGAAAWGYTTYFVTPMYQASISIYVNNSTVNTNTNTITSSDLNTAQKLVNTYMAILESDTVLDRVAEEVGSNLSADQIRKVMTAESINETEVFRVMIADKDPDLAAKIANTVAKVAPNEIEEIVTGSSAKIVDYAKVPAAPSSPNVSRNALLGVVLGVVLAVVIVVIQVLLDVRIRDDADLLQISDAPILGRIPDFTVEEKNGSGYKSNTSAEAGDKAVEK